MRTFLDKVLTFSPAPFCFGFGALALLPELLRQRGIGNVYLVTDHVLAANGLLDRVLSLLAGVVKVEVFADVPAEPKAADMESLTPRAGPDALIGLGGGSAMDFAKALSVLISHGAPLSRYVGEGKVPGPTVPVVCIPTTAGTGSQATQTAVFTVDGVKRGASSEEIRPVFSIVDPELTLTLPPAVTRNSGYDALMHSIESFIARPSSEVAPRLIHYQGSNSFSTGLSREAFSLLWGAYRSAIDVGDDREARRDMAMGAHLAGLAFSHSGLGLVHALASALGGMVDAPHGVCLAACTDLGLRYNAPYCTRGLAALGSLAGGDDRGGDDERAEGFLAILSGLIHDLDLPLRPSQLGLTRSDAGALLEKTLVQVRRLPTNPRPIDEELLGAIERGI